jgi:hypothetical protein
LFDAGGVRLIERALLDGLYQVEMSRPGQEDENYQRRLAARQGPAVCACLLATDRDGEGSARSHRTPLSIGSRLRKSPKELHRSFSFLRTCLASLLDNTTITEDTLSAILRRSGD